MSNLNIRYRVHLSDEVRDALAHGSPVVAFESVFFTHRVPYPQNVSTALACERIARQHGAVPAICAVIDGKLYAGLTDEQLDYLGKQGKNILKASCSELPVLIAKKQDGAVTVAAAMQIASMVGIKVVAVGGIGGIHRCAGSAMDISPDLNELGRTAVTVVCAGAKGVPDIGRTLEYLEARGVPVVGFKTDDMPAFYTRASGFKAGARADSVAELTAMVDASAGIRIGGGLLVANPVPKDYELDASVVHDVTEQALADADAQNVPDSELTPFLIERINSLTNGLSLKTNIAILYNNTRLAAQIASGRGD